MQRIQPAFTFVFGHLAPKPLTLLAETETVATPFYRNRKQTETAFSIGFGAETETEFRSVSNPLPVTASLLVHRKTPP